MDIETLFREADFLSISVPLNDATRGLVDMATVATMKPTAILINVARGPVIDTPAVLAALREGRLGGAALDVLPTEPPQARPTAPNLIVTPHAAYYSPESEERAYRLCVARVREVLGGP